MLVVCAFVQRFFFRVFGVGGSGIGGVAKRQWFQVNVYFNDLRAVGIGTGDRQLLYRKLLSQADVEWLGARVTVGGTKKLQ